MSFISIDRPVLAPVDCSQPWLDAKQELEMLIPTHRQSQTLEQMVVKQPIVCTIAQHDISGGRVVWPNLGDETDLSIDSSRWDLP